MLTDSSIASLPSRTQYHLLQLLEGIERWT